MGDYSNRDFFMQGKPNDLVARIKGTEFFKPIWVELDSMLRPEL